MHVLPFQWRDHEPGDQGRRDGTEHDCDDPPDARCLDAGENEPEDESPHATPERERNDLRNAEGLRGLERVGTVRRNPRRVERGQDRMMRAPLIALGRSFGARVAAYFFETAVKDAVARNRLREGRARVPDVAIYITSKKIVPPSLEEGFDEVRVIAPLPVTAP